MRRGNRRWAKVVFDVVEQLRAALLPDEIVLGGGNSITARRVTARVAGWAIMRMPSSSGFRLWDPDWVAHLTTVT